MRQNELLKSFTYALAPGACPLNPIERKVMVLDDEEVQGDHVVVHELEPSQKLADVVAGRHNFTKALVIVNSTESLALESSYLDGYTGINYPVLIVSWSNGQEILSLVEQEGHLMCDIKADSAVDALPHHQQPLGHTLVMTEPPRAKTAAAG